MIFSRVSTVLSHAASHDLVDLAQAKTELSLLAGDTSNDAWLSQAIFQVSGAIERYTSRVFVPEQVQDAFYAQRDADPRQTSGGFPVLLLSRWPVLQVASVVLTLTGGADPQTQTLTEGLEYRVVPNTGELLRLAPSSGLVVPWRALAVTVVYAAGCGQLVQETDTVPGGEGPYTFTVSQAADFSSDISVAYADGTALTAVAANPSQSRYSVVNGVYTLNPADADQALAVAYTVTDIPAGLVEICLELITGRFYAKGRDPTLMQRDTPGIGTQRWWVGGSAGQNGPFPPDIAAALDDYRPPALR